MAPSVVDRIEHVELGDRDTRGSVPDDALATDPAEPDPLRVNLPRIGRMDRDGGRLFVPADLEGGAGYLLVPRMSQPASATHG